MLGIGSSVVAPLAVADDRRSRGRGLLGSDGLDGALLLTRTRSVHTFGMRYRLDVALCSSDLVVLAVLVLPPGRVTAPRRYVRAVLEAEAGSFDLWGLVPGAQLSVR